MKNIKNLAIIRDGVARRIAITFDDVDENGKIIKSNIKINRVVVDQEVIGNIEKIESFAQSVIDAE